VLVPLGKISELAVRVPQNIQVTALGGDISHLDRVVVRELILDGQVLRLYQRRLVVVLAGIEGKAQIVAADVLTATQELPDGQVTGVVEYGVGLCSTVGLWKLKTVKAVSMVAA
jgi:hypothetical protein